MSHNIMHETYPLGVNRKKVEASWDNYVAHADYGEGASGLPNPIRWIENGVSESYSEAEKRIEKLDDGWYDQLAVKYKEYQPCKTKKYLDLKTRLAEARKSYDEKVNRVHYSAQNVSSEFVGCKHCGSKIAVKYIKKNFCPVCGNDLRPASTLQNIENARKKVEDLEKQISIEESKAKYEIRWLLKIEYHT